MISKKLFSLRRFFPKVLNWNNFWFSFNNIFFMFDSKMVFSHCSFKSFFEISWCAFWTLLVFDTFLKIFIKCFYFVFWFFRIGYCFGPFFFAFLFPINQFLFYLLLFILSNLFFHLNFIEIFN